ncbi:hypothetical protein CASFOL_032647 [Castilleja foliolosa]|uniref:Peptidase A1 domain-containing protein n=1 Tax=Castilleja foliolosa TaxID=1961234 RepID=A0ABD3C3U8_9LAMI
MSSFFSFPSMALLISLFALASLLASPTLSTSTDDTLETIGFKATLNHLDHGKSLTKTELLQRGMQRREIRQAVMQQLAAAPPSPTRSIKASTSGYNGEFYMNLTIGTPPRNYTLLIDTDTDLLWIKQCDKTSTSYSTLPCSSDLCKNVGYCTKKGTCQYKYQYSSNNKVLVDLATETFTFGENATTLGFSCGVPIIKGPGVVGLGHGPLSLISQMKASTFSFCLPSYDNANKTGVVVVGTPIKTPAKMITTSLVTNKFVTTPNTPYYINVTGISVGNISLPIDPSSFWPNQIDGTGGMIVDTGCTVTYLKESVFEQVKKEVSNQVQRQLKVRITNDYSTQLQVCFTIPINLEKTFIYPTIRFHLGGKVDLLLAIDNTYREYSEGKNSNKTCLAIKPASPLDRGMSSLGNIQLQNTLVTFDLVKETVAFLPNTECDKM